MDSNPYESPQSERVQGRSFVRGRSGSIVVGWMVAAGASLLLLPLARLFAETIPGLRPYLIPARFLTGWVSFIACGMSVHLMLLNSFHRDDSQEG